MRRTVLVIAVVALLTGCGGSEKKPATTATLTQPAKSPPTTPGETPYKPSASHKHRPPGSIYNDEVGENVLSAPYDRVIQVFGPPASRHGRCIKYHIVGQPKGKWTFCFKGQKMISASG